MSQSTGAKVFKPLTPEKALGLVNRRLNDGQPVRVSFKRDDEIDQRSFNVGIGARAARTCIDRFVGEDWQISGVE
jgi:hypothetical protein